MNSEQHLTYDPSALRYAIIEAVNEQTMAPNEIGPKHILVPPTHRKALDYQNSLVIGMRGAGKTFWWRALHHQPNILYLAGSERQLSELSNVVVSACFGEKAASSGQPDRDELAQVLQRDARLVWKTVCLVKILEDLKDSGLALDTSQKVWVERFEKQEGWKAKVDFLVEHPTEVKMTFNRIDEWLGSKGRKWLGLFDALDRSANDWERMDKLTRGLLMLALEFAAYRHIRLKIFLRPDQFERSQVTNFPDSSKLLPHKVELEWSKRDLYNLFWHYLLNLSSDAYRQRVIALMRSRGLEPRWLEQFAVYSLPRQLEQDEDTQRTLFHKLTGEWMGQDHRRGFPYTWLVNHLADANGCVSPRSFIVALHGAANDTLERYPSHEYAIHYNSIKRGVQKASIRRVAELKEDYPWIEYLMTPLAGLSVPMPFSEIELRWQENQTLEGLLQKQDELLPSRIAEGANGVRKDLEELGIFSRLRDGRVDLPDVFRVAFRLGRKGGVKPVK